MPIQTFYIVCFQIRQHLLAHSAILEFSRQQMSSWTACVCSGETRFPDEDHLDEQQEQEDATQPALTGSAPARSSAANARASSPIGPSPRTAAKSTAKKRKAEDRGQPEEAENATGEGATQAEEVKQEGVDPANGEEEAYEKLKFRRMLPGAATSDKDFDDFFLNLEVANDIFRLEPAEEIDTSDTILHKVRLWTGSVADVMSANTPDYIVRLCVGVLAFGKARQADIFLREHALLYWIAEGGRTLRFHSGDCYMKSPSGAFQQHRGVPPDHDRVQMFLMHLEGIFRRMPRNTQRATRNLLTAVERMFAEADGDQVAFLTACVDACLNFEGDASARKGQGKGEEDDVAPPGGPWTAASAKTVLAVKKQLSYELTQDKLLHYMCEWCDTPKVVEGACCYEDCCIKYDFEESAAKQVQRAALTNCYLRIPHCLKGTIPQNVVDRLRKFYAQTFWGNIDVFKCGQAAQALAKRGINVVRLFIGLSSGGVGQSLYSTHLEAMYVHNFAFFDPNIWYNEEENAKTG